MLKILILCPIIYIFNKFTDIVDDAGLWVPLSE